MGDSTYSTPARNDDINIEMMARDLFALIEHLGWNDIDILGFSMGGTSPYHLHNVPLFNIVRSRRRPPATIAIS